MESSVAVELYVATLDVVQIVILAWIGSEQAASRRERNRRHRLEENDSENV